MINIFYRCDISVSFLFVFGMSVHALSVVPALVVLIIVEWGDFINQIIRVQSPILKFCQLDTVLVLTCSFVFNICASIVIVHFDYQFGWQLRSAAFIWRLLFVCGMLRVSFATYLFILLCLP